MIDTTNFVPPAPEPPSQEGSAPAREPRAWVRRLGLIGALATTFVAGATAEYATAPEYTETTEYAVAQDEFADRANHLDARELELDEFADDVAALDSRSLELDQRNVDLTSREGELDAREAALDTKAGDLDTREAEITTTEAEVAAGTIPGDGIFLVGTDVQPGDYRGNGSSDMCYWARLSGTSGDLDDVIANGLPGGPTVVTISASDAAFETNGCGAWQLIP